MLFPDRRDLPVRGRPGPVVELEMKLGRRLVGMAVTDLSPVEAMIEVIASCRWQHPVLVVHRSADETKWSHLTVQRQGEDEEVA